MMTNQSPLKTLLDPPLRRSRRVTAFHYTLPAYSGVCDFSA